MSPRTKKQLEQLKDKRRQQIMDAALELFAKEGYHATSISDIASKAGIAKGLLYNYFSSKEELLEKIYYSGLDEILGIFDPNKDGVLTNEEMKFFIDELFHMAKRRPDFWKLYFSLTLQPSVQSQFKGHNIRELADPFFIEMADYLRRLKFKNPEEEAYIFHCLMDGIFINYTLDPENFPVEKVKKTLLARYTK